MLGPVNYSGLGFDSQSLHHISKHPCATKNLTKQRVIVLLVISISNRLIYIGRLAKAYNYSKERESDFVMIDCGEIEVIGINPNTEVRYDGHCSIGTATGAHSVHDSNELKLALVSPSRKGSEYKVFGKISMLLT